VGRPHRRRRGQRGQPAQGRELGPGQLFRAVRAEQVGARRGTHDQRPAGEHPGRAGAVAQQERQVLVGVARRGERGQAQSAEIDLVAVAQPTVGEPALAGGGGQHGGAVVVGQLHRPGEEVGVQVGVGDEPDPQPRLLRRRPHRPQITGRVDDQR
jgi:hypothetical protein